MTSTVKPADEQQPEPAGPPPGVRTMSIVRWTIVVVAGVVALFSIASYAGLHLGGLKDRGANVQLYHCPMHPAVIQDHPGECPICNMTLVPKPAGPAKPASDAMAAADPASQVPGLTAVDLSPDRIQLIGMRTAVVKREALAPELRTVGVVAPSERGLAQINTRFEGWVETLTVSETGERVRRGQVLATIYSPELLKAQQELLVARGWSGQAKAPAAEGSSAADDFDLSLNENARRRLELLGISAQEIDHVIKTGKPLQAIPIRSPVDGYVIGKNAVVGLAVQPGTVLFEVADLSQLWVTADIYELDVARVRIGQPARFEPSSFSGDSYAGKVEFIYPVLDAQSRTLRVRLAIKNRFDKSGPRLRPGMYGAVHLSLPSSGGLMVPSEAVVDTGDMHYLFVAKAGGHFEPRRVKVGARARDKIEVVSGVSEGETVVTTGNFLIDSESRLRSAIDSPSAP